MVAKVAVLLVVHAALVLGGVYYMLVEFGDQLERELDDQVERVQRDFERDLDRLPREFRRELRRELDRRTPAAPPPLGP